MACFREILSVGLVCYVYLTIYLLLLPLFCRKWPYSKYYTGEKNDPEIVRELLAQNDARISSAESVLRKYNSASLSGSIGKRVDLVIAVITVSRESENIGQLGFLTQTVAQVLSLVQGTKPRIFDNVQVIICNVDQRGHHHSEAMSFSGILPVLSRFPNSSSEKEKKTDNFGVFEKEKTDYVYCLQEAKLYNPRFILMMEDDVILYSHSLTTVTHLLNLHLSPINLYDDKTKPWLFVKLYYPEKWQGYGNEPDKIGELIGIGILGGTLFTCISWICLKFITVRIALNTRLFSLFFLGAVTSILTSVLIGRPYIQAWRRYSPYTHRLIPAPDCCTQAILYPVAVVDDLAEHLTEVTCTMDFSVDLAIDAFARKRRLKRLLVEPNLCQHIGFVSTVRSYAKSAAEFLE